jgi:hypothetical protein
MTNTKRQTRTRQELILKVWEELDRDSVGAAELRQIQEKIRERFGEGAVESPTAIARVLAEDGAVLRHPEVLACDTEWRESEIKRAWPLDQFLFSTIVAAEESVMRLEAWRRELIAEHPASHWPREVGLGLKQHVQLIAHSRVVGEEERAVAREVLQWLVVWLQEPHLFEDWLELRKRSPEYTKKFPD